MKKLIVSSLILTAMTTGLQTANADTNAITPLTNTAQHQAQKTWLGVSLSAVPEVLSQQLGDVIPAKQGVMVQSVSSGSPAQKAGLKAFDIILNYGDQKLYSAEQLAGLVASDKADNSITLGVVRNGTKKDIKVTLGAHDLVVSPMQGHPMFGINQPIMPSMPAFPNGMSGFNIPNNASGKTNVMQQFESIQVQKLDGDRYHAEVSYQENGGNKKQFTFEGKYKEIRKQIEENKELPKDKKNSLLNALKNNPNQLMPDGFMDFPAMPMMPPMPSFDKYFNNTPSWFRNDRRL